MKTEKLKPQTLEEVAQDWGIDYQVFKIKSELITTIKHYCDAHGVSQRKLAAMVPGLTQDRVSKIFSGQVGHMTIDKLVEILSALKFKVAVKAKAA
jgi:predicted XRE-type DNA-binding protein